MSFTEVPYISGKTGDSHQFSAVPSACSDDRFSAAARIDPYWAAVWSPGSQASWLSHDVAVRQVSAGLGRLPAHLDIERDTAVAALQDPATLPRRLAGLSVLDSWRTVTGEQMSAITGDADYATGRSQSMGELFAAGVADVGIFTNGLYNSKSAARATLYRPSRTHAFKRDIEPHLTYPEWVSVTGGTDWESGSQFDRHNLLATELALRVAEWCEIGAVVGEKLSTWELLAHSGAGFAEASGAKRAADATLIRTDGARIALEITATTGRNFEAKVRRWAELLSNRRMTDTGLSVIFVLAPHADKKVKAGEYMTMVKKLVAAATRDFPGVAHDRTAQRIFVAEWTDWFPAPHQVSQSFFALEAQRPTGPPDRLWEPAGALDPLDSVFEPRDAEFATAAIDNLSAIRSVPHWLRTGRPRELWPLAVTALGYTGIPVPAPSRPETYVGRQLGAGAGVATQTRPPERLRAI